MPLYKSATKQTVSHKRFAINEATGVQLAEVHPELEELVKTGVLTVEYDKEEPTVAVESPKVEAPKVDSPVKPTV
jgi:hypothetical protein